MFASIDFRTLSGFLLESVLDKVKDCLIKGGKFGGRVFGGYVRDVIVPRSYNSTCHVTFKHVDVWFTCQEDADMFVETMGSSFKKNPHWDMYMSNPIYKFGHKQYSLHAADTIIAWFGVNVSPTIPVDDFNVNCLTYLVTENGFLPESFGKYSVEQLLTMIKDKEAIMLPEYKSKLTGSHKTIHINRIKTRYIERGWKIVYTDELPMNFDHAWIRTHFKESTKERSPETRPKCNNVSFKHSPKWPISDHSNTFELTVNNEIKHGRNDDNPVVPFSEFINKSNFTVASNTIKADPNIELLKSFNEGVDLMRAAFIKALGSK